MAVHGGIRLQKHSEEKRGRGWDAAAWATLGLLLAVVLLTFRDYGVSWDEQGQGVYGRLLLDYYASGLSDTSAFSFSNLFYYGGAFDLLATLLQKISPFPEYETRHLLGGLTGLLGLAGVWRLGRDLGGPRAGFLSLLLLAATARYYGHFFSNPKDIPFAAAMTWSLVFFCRVFAELPRVRLSTGLWLGLAFGLALGTRVGAVIIAPSFLLPFLLRLLGRLRQGVWPAEALWEGVVTLVRLVPAGLTAYGVMLLCWPWAAQDLLNPLLALSMFKSFPFKGVLPFDGQLVPAMELPWTYLPKLLLFCLPPTLLVGLALALLTGTGTILLRPGSLLEAKSLGVLAVLLTAAVPIAYFIAVSPPAYNGIRHFLFVLPPLAVLAALGINLLLELPAPLSGLVWGLTALGIFWQAWTMVQLHPHQYVYFNSLTGGPAGAEGRYEVEYWGTSLRETTLRLADILERAEGVPEQPHKVWVCADQATAATYFPAWMVAVKRRSEADFQIAVNQFYCPSPPGSRRLVETRRLGALLSFAEDLRQAEKSDP